MPSHTYTFRVRYAEIDKLGTYYNSRALEWFEAGRSELARAMGMSYAEWEKRGVYLPLVEAHVRFRGPAGFDDLLEMSVTVQQEGRVRLRFSNQVCQAESRAPVCEGYTIHAVVDRDLKPTRTPAWVQELVKE